MRSQTGDFAISTTELNGQIRELVKITDARRGEIRNLATLIESHDRRMLLVETLGVVLVTATIVTLAALKIILR